MPSQQQRDEGDSGSARRGPTPLACEMFGGINTATTRSGVPDQQMFWCDGFIPLSPRNLRVVPGIGSALFTPGGGKTVVCFYFYNIASTAYAAVFLSDGSVVQVRTSDGANEEILPQFSINNVNITQLGVAQYGSQYLIIVSNQTNGYWLWDGTLLYGAGTLAPGVTLTNVGEGYFAPPTVTVTGGNGTGAQAIATIGDSVVTNVTITNPGSGYLAGDTPTLVFTGGTQAGSGGSLTAVLSHVAGGSGGMLTFNYSLAIMPNTFRVDTVTVNNGGSGYSQLTQVNAPPGNAGHPASLQTTIAGGVITAVTVVGDGGHYINQTPQNYTIVDNGYYHVTSVTIVSGGSGYGPSATIAVSGGGSPQTQAVLVPVQTSGVITSVTITDGGVYGSNTPPTLVVNDMATDAAGTIELMPFGVQGTCVETYAGHVWVANGPLVTFTAPGSVSDFSSGNGGGSFTSSDSFLRVGYTRLIQTNGFLFLIGDSSMNYISGVMTNTPQGGNPTTTFTNNNSDPETGTPYPASVATIGQDIFIANQNGIYISTGGTFDKKSEALDGVYNTAPGIFNGKQLSAAKALIFGKLIWMALVPIIDPVTMTQRTKIFMYNENHKYWWSSEQDVTLTFIQTQEINSVYRPYGTDGVSIYPLFTTPSTAFTKRFQSRLWDAPAGYDHTKSSVNLFAMAQFLGSSNSYNIFIDNEKGVSQRAGPYTHTDTPAADQEVTSVMPPTAIGQIGVLTGMTIETTADDLVVVSVMMQDEVVQYRA